MGAALAIGRATLAGPGAGEGRARLAPALEAVPLDALGLPPGALLLVPRLASPRPLRPGPARSDFAQALARLLAAALAEAERDPVTGIADRPRLFTSAAAHRAWQIGAMQDGLTAPAHHPPALRPATAAVVRALLADGCLLPLVLARLVAAGRAARLLAGLATADLAVATAALARAWPLPPAWPPGAATDPLPAFLRATPSGRLERLLAEATAADPTIARLEPPARLLLLAALDVAQHPAAGRDRTWLAQLAALAGPPPSGTGSAAVEKPAGPAGGAAIAPPEGPAPGPAAAAASGRPQSTPIRPAGLRVPPPAVSHLPGPRALQAEAPGLPAPVADAGVPSAHAGLLFLLNALVALGLTPGPASPRAPGAAPLALLAALGHALFGPGFGADPLATAAAGQTQSWPAVRPELLNPALAARALRRTPSATPLLLLGPHRLVLADLGTPRRPPPAIAARRAARAIGARLHPLPVLGPRLPRCNPARRTASLARLLRHRLADSGVTPSDLRVPGTLFRSDGALDVRFALADLPFAIRAAGLDRDPGFLPRAGLTVRFHFA